jgi:hypothetical protein
MASTINGTSTGSGGLISSGDDSGILNIQTNETTAMSIDASQSVDFTNNIDAPNTFGFKNRFINGNMVIDQRNAGAAVTLSVEKFPVDRFICRAMTATDSTAQQSSTVPAGFNKSLLYTVGTGAAPAATDRNTIVQIIEGNNLSDLGWGAAGAQTITLSFWVRSSLTGTFGGALANGSVNRSYPFTYTISAANTFEYKTITIAGDTSGTWAKDNGAGMYVWFDMGCGSTYLGTAGAWASADYRGATGDTKLISTTGATFYITGVQLEKGTQATSFDFRSIGQELLLCQRYYWKTLGGGNESIGIAGYNVAGNALWGQFSLPVTMRATPTVTVNGTWAVSNTGQPTIRAASATNFLMQAVATASGALAAYPNSSDDFIDASIEL